MKRLILSAMVMAFAVALQASDAKCSSDKEQGGCCAKTKVSTEAKTKVSTDAKSECSMSKQAKGECPFAAKAKAASKDAAAKQSLVSPKMADAAK